MSDESNVAKQAGQEYVTVVDNEPTWIAELVKECIEYPASSEDAVRKAIAATIKRCAAVANGGRQYAEGDIRSVVAAIQSLTTDNDPWFQDGG